MGGLHKPSFSSFVFLTTKIVKKYRPRKTSVQIYFAMLQAAGGGGGARRMKCCGFIDVRILFINFASK